MQFDLLLRDVRCGSTARIPSTGLQEPCFRTERRTCLVNIEGKVYAIRLAFARRSVRFYCSDPLYGAAGALLSHGTSHLFSEHRRQSVCNSTCFCATFGAVLLLGSPLRGCTSPAFARNVAPV